MGIQENLNYNRIANAIDYIKQNFKKQPNLDQVADYINLSPFHFQRLFLEWAGTTPKKFLQYISAEHAKKILKESRVTLSETAFDTGLSSTSRLHDLFITTQGMTPAEYKNGGINLAINFSFAPTPFGKIIVASTNKGICYMAFIDNEKRALNDLINIFPNAKIYQKSDLNQQNALLIFQTDWGQLPRIKLHLKGSQFQLKVWEALLKIPMGQLVTYGAIAGKTGNPNAARAVGTAIGNNPVAFLIPCHRVIQSSGIFGGYMWGNTRKTAIIGWERGKLDAFQG